MNAMDRIAKADSGVFSNAYLKAVFDFARFGGEDRLTVAYDLARKALNGGFPLAEVSAAHHTALHQFHSGPDREIEQLNRMEQFFFEVISVYDMALCGYRSNAARLVSENIKRKKVERELHELTNELREQRDGLDEEVRARTDELAQKTRVLEKTNQKLQHTTREQAAFTYAISHDLKSPITTIRMLVSEIADCYSETLDSDANELIDLTQQTIQRMGNLVDDILRYSRTIEEEISTEVVNLNTLLCDILADLKGDIDQHRIKVNVAKIPPVQGNKMQLRILFQNLICNALKFRSAERPAYITIFSSVDPSTQSVRISVADNGIGIEKRHQDKIFSLFQRLHTHDAYPGSGLGLALCTRIALNHKGTISLTSSPNEGSTFTLKIDGNTNDV